MERLESGSWDFLPLDDTGTVLEDADPTLCQRCHTEAPSGALFGLPPRFLSESGMIGAGGEGGAATLPSKPADDPAD